MGNGQDMGNKLGSGHGWRAEGRQLAVEYACSAGQS